VILLDESELHSFLSKTVNTKSFREKAPLIDVFGWQHQQQVPDLQSFELHWSPLAPLRMSLLKAHPPIGVKEIEKTKSFYNSLACSATTVRQRLCLGIERSRCGLRRRNRSSLI
jgi:hypothetical protein